MSWDAHEDDPRVMTKIVPFELNGGDLQPGEYLMKRESGAHGMGGCYLRFFEPIAMEDLRPLVTGTRSGDYFRHKLDRSLVEDRGISDQDHLVLQEREVEPGDLALVEMPGDCEHQRYRWLRIIRKAEDGGLCAVHPRSSDDSDPGGTELGGDVKALGVVVGLFRTILAF